LIRLRVKEVAEAKKITMTRLSRLADINYQTIQAIFRDPYRDVAYSTLLKISKVLNVKVDELVEEIEDQ
jgi:DNA-binding Xre family transcriptional regulator